MSMEDHDKFVEQQSEEKIAKFPPGFSAEKLKSSLGSYKGKFTSALNLANSNLNTFQHVKREEYTDNWRKILYKSKDETTIYKNVLEYIFQMYLQVCDAGVLDTEEAASKDGPYC